MPVLGDVGSRLGRSGALLTGACIAAVFALALPWSSPSDAAYVPGWFVPGSCVTEYDLDGWPSMYCTPGMLSPGMFFPGTGAAGGKDTAIRVLLVAVIALVVLARRRHSTALARAAVAVAVLGLALGGLRPRSGQLVYLAGMALLVLALRADGLLGRTGRPMHLPGQTGQVHSARATAAGAPAGIRAQPPAGTTSPTT